jgi:MFS transporter, PAT family, beta-lactamase induction signal transducer AmpG
MMRLPNLLATRRGRLAAFFLLYMTEGIPFGFATIAMATQMRRTGLSATAIGSFVAAVYLPWAFKWAVGPLVDVIASDRLGRRRGWILLMQLFMVATLLLLLQAGMTASIATLTGLIILHNCFAATQDVAIDALAVNTLHDDERGLANGLMFGGSYFGQAVGGSGALLLTSTIGFNNTFLFVAAAILSVTIFVVLPMREVAIPRVVAAGRGALSRVGNELASFVRESWTSFAAHRSAVLGLVLGLLPIGAMALGLALQTNLAVEFGMDDNQTGQLTLWSSILTALGCVGGGWLSDRYGRRRMLAMYIGAMSIPTLWLAYVCWQQHWIFPAATGAAAVAVPAVLITVFWVSSMVYAVFNGLMYGTRAALFMDLTNPRVAATQFTLYMALMNLTLSYSSQWQGYAVDHVGYPTTLVIDSVFGLVCLLLLPFISKRPVDRISA